MTPQIFTEYSNLDEKNKEKKLNKKVLKEITKTIT